MKTIVITLIACAIQLSSAISQSTTTSNDSELTPLRKNSVYYEFLGQGLFFGSVNYDRIILRKNKMGIVARGGLSIYVFVFVIGEVDFLFGGPKNFLEFGIGTNTFWPVVIKEDQGEFRGSDLVIYYRLPGYRLHSNRGFHFRLAPYLYGNSKELVFWPSASLGYSF
jgi:hypothetical protein